MTKSAQRIPSVRREDWTDEIRDVFAINEGREGWENGSRYNLIHWFANHPELAQGWLKYNHALVRGDFPPDLREIVILRVAHLFKSQFEWDGHLLIAGAIGLGPDHFEAVIAGPDAALWSDLQRLCLRATDQLCLSHDIDDETWNALASKIDTRQIMELLFIVGSYSMLAWIFRAARIPLDTSPP